MYYMLFFREGRHFSRSVGGLFVSGIPDVLSGTAFVTIACLLLGFARAARVVPGWSLPWLVVPLFICGVAALANGLAGDILLRGLLVGRGQWLTALASCGTALALAVLFQTARKRSAREHAAAARIEDLYQNAPCGFHSIDGNGIFMAVNDTELAWFGYAREEVIGKLSFRTLLTEASRRLFDEHFDRFKATGRVRNFELELRHKDGGSIPVLVNATAVYDEAGQFVASRSVLIDRTELHRTREAEEQMRELTASLEHRIAERTQALRESEEKFRTAFDHAPNGMAIVSLEGRFVKVNPALCEIVGYPTEELLARDFQSITHPDDLEADLGHVRRLLAGAANNFAMEKRYHHKDSHIVWVMLTVTLVRDEVGQPVHFISQVQDITERKRAEERIHTALEEKETLLKEVHHRVKNNLAVVCELLQLQARRLGESRLYEILIESRDRVYAMAVVHEMLYQSHNLAAVELPAYIERMTRHLLASYRAGENVHFSASCDPIALPLETAIPFGLLLNELISNCLKHAFPDGRAGKIRVTVRHRNQRLELAVQDDGVGFPEDVQPRSSRTMGLRLIQGLTGQLKGTLEYLPSSGTWIRIEFPVPPPGGST
jgi:PAS domain S-box-containing protein